MTCDVDTVTTRTAEFLSAVSIPILAANVPREFTGIDDVEGPLRGMRATHPGLICVTLGERGSAALDGDRFVHAPAVSVRAVDTTAAGDVFNGALLKALADGATLEQASHFACQAAAISVTRMGAQSSAPYQHELDSFFN